MGSNPLTSEPASNPRQVLRDFIVDNFFVDDFADDASFLREGIIDSMGMTQLVAFVEKEFGFQVSDDELIPGNLDSLDRLVAFVERRRGTGG
ncbi:MAG TPA: acyl carrier protein [Myxococcales bacterium]|jgi:acyl carrier protein